VNGRAPTQTFTGRLDLKVGDKGVRLIEVGPAHTAGDVLVHVPTDRTVFTGDILFIDGTPIMWEGPVGNWLLACEAILEMDVDHIVPGHGPLTDRAGVRAVHDYLGYITQEARKRYDAGLSAADAAFDIGLGRFDAWSDAERLAVNVDTLYREFAHDHSPRNTLALFELMGRLYYDRKGCPAA
jgi:glyoxylase-like metal-dependent hydrolase (beta-lactamase superfamily II)